VAQRSRLVSAGIIVVLVAACSGRHESPSEPASPGSSPALTFSQIQTTIFTPTCAKAGCHSSGTAASGLVLDSGRAYSGIVGQPSQENPALLLISPGDPERSYLLKKIRGDPDITGARMPADGPPFLTSDQIGGLTAWIRAGAPNN
jgi:hypothetical protein